MWRALTYKRKGKEEKNNSQCSRNLFPHFGSEPSQQRAHLKRCQAYRCFPWLSCEEPHWTSQEQFYSGRDWCKREATTNRNDLVGFTRFWFLRSCGVHCLSPLGFHTLLCSAPTHGISVWGWVHVWNFKMVVCFAWGCDLESCVGEWTVLDFRIVFFLCSFVFLWELELWHTEPNYFQGQDRKDTRNENFEIKIIMQNPSMISSLSCLIANFNCSLELDVLLANGFTYISLRHPCLY